MKKTPLLLLIFAVGLVCVWLLLRPAQPNLNKAALPTPPLDEARQTAPAIPTHTVGVPGSDMQPGAEASMPLLQAWIEARSASITITQTVDPVTAEPVGTIKIGKQYGNLGETPPFYRMQLKTGKFPILLGDKNTRHHFIRSITSVRLDGNSLELKPEIFIQYPRSASLGGFVFHKNQDPITQVGLIIPDVKVPEGDDPESQQWATSIRIGSQELSEEDLGKAKSQPIGSDTVLVMPTQTAPPPATARVLWLALDVNGSFTVVLK